MHQPPAVPESLDLLGRRSTGSSVSKRRFLPLLTTLVLRSRLTVRAGRERWYVRYSCYARLADDGRKHFAIFDTETV